MSSFSDIAGAARWISSRSSTGGARYASATADSFTIEITVRTDQLLDTAKVLTELELI